MGLWTYAELSIGIIISCLPVIPRFFQHFGPRLSRALTFRYGVTKELSRASESERSHNQVRGKKLTLPSFKNTFASVTSPDTERGDGDHELYTQHSLPKKEYVKLHEETAVPRRDSAGDLVPMPRAKLATVRHDLEGGNEGL